MPKPTYYNPNQGGLLPSAAEDNGAGSLALLTLAGCAEGAIGAALSIIVEGELSSFCSSAAEPRSRASSTATDDEESEESEDEDSEEELELTEGDKRNQRRKEAWEQRKRQREERQQQQQQASSNHPPPAAASSGPNTVSDEGKLDYDNKKMVNKFHRPLKGKSQNMIPIGPLKMLETDDEKRSFCRKWRNCTTHAEQKALEQRYTADAKAKKKAARDAKARDNRMKKKREEEAKAERRRKRKEVSDAKARDRDIRRNDNKRKKRAEAKEQENIVSIYCLHSCYCSIIFISNYLLAPHQWIAFR